MKRRVGIVLLLVAVAFAGLLFVPRRAESPEAPVSTATDESSGPAETAAASDEATCPEPALVGQGPHRAGLLVTFGDGTSRALCIRFAEDALSGDQVLERSGLHVITQDFGNLGKVLCKLADGDVASGCDYPRQDCFCRGAGGSWVIFDADAGPAGDGSVWQPATAGMSSTRVADGDAQAYLWGDDSMEPPACPFARICRDPGDMSG